VAQFFAYAFYGWYYIMFVRFRQRKNRLYVNLAQSRRIDGKVRQEYVATLGAIPLPADSMSDADRCVSTRARQALWAALVDCIRDLHAVEQDKLVSAVSARIPFPTEYENGAAELYEARESIKGWEFMSDGAAFHIKGYQDAIAIAETKIADWRKSKETIFDKGLEEAKAIAARLGNYG
jgi:hypothetical protein